MSIKIALLGFGTQLLVVFHFFYLKNNGRLCKRPRWNHEMVKDIAEKERLVAAKESFYFVTTIDEILNDKEVILLLSW